MDVRSGKWRKSSLNYLLSFLGVFFPQQEKPNIVPVLPFSFVGLIKHIFNLNIRKFLYECKGISSKLILVSGIHCYLHRLNLQNLYIFTLNQLDISIVFLYIPFKQASRNYCASRAYLKIYLKSLFFRMSTF